MLDKFRLINPRSASRTSPSVAEMALQEEDDLSEYGDDLAPPMPISRAPASQVPSAASTALPTPKGSGKSSGGKSLVHPKEKEEKAKSKASKASTPPKEEREPAAGEAGKKGSKIASLIPKGGKPAGGKKESGAQPASSGIPKPGLKAPQATAKQSQASATPGGAAASATGAGGTGSGPGPAGVGARDGGEKVKHAKGSQYSQRERGGR
ncbi:hypothetical protein AALO_G00224260 [Alosa alosa]|uniref:Translation initiation factor IF-2 n=1 Tax=Alosa alosa TaxID=278164 RepID=A0AAV6FXS2_9TELE|nr:hypothetical protein AALO_G00224260 [Alosa alosa]